MTGIGLSEIGSGEEVSADTADLTFFVDNGQTYVSHLNEILYGLRRAITEVRSYGLDFVPPITGGQGGVGSVEQLLGIATDNNRFVGDLVDSLLDHASARRLPLLSDLRNAVLHGSLPFPDIGTRDQVVAAMRQGLSPSEANLAPQYFPSTYRNLLKADDRLDQLAVEREDADGSSWSWLDGDSDRLAVIDARIDREEERRQRLAGLLGADSDARLSDVEAIASVGQWTRDEVWEGQRYAQWVEGYVADNSRRLESGRLQLHRVDGDAGADGDFELIGQRLATRSEASLKFFNGVGVSNTAALPTFVVDNFPPGGDNQRLDAVVQSFGDALALATTLEDEDGHPRLTFTGDELINVDRPATKHNLLWYHPALLFTGGQFETQFLADATTAALVSAQTGDPRATEMIIGRVQSLGNTWWNESGEDPRNVLLARAAEDPAATAMIVDQVSSGSSDLGPLLFPEAPFEPTAVVHPPDDFHPPLGSDYPITSLLVAAGLDDEAANAIINAAASDPERGFSDTGVAAGLDGILAMHATLMYPDGSLEPVGVSRSGINDGVPGGGPADVTAYEWRLTLRKVMDYGHGQQLAQATNVLLGEAIGGSITSDGFDPGPVGPFAIIAGATNSEVREARLAYAAGLDDDARRSNRFAGTVASGTFAVLGLATGPAGVVASVAGVGYTAFGPEGLPTDNELSVYQDEYAQMLYAGQDRSTGWANLIYDQMLEHAAQTGKLELTVPGATEPQLVNITSTKIGHQWQHPTTGDWHDMPMVFGGEFSGIFNGTNLELAVDQNNELQTWYIDGVISAADRFRDVYDARVAVQADGSRPGATPDRIRAAVANADRIRIDDWLPDG